MKYRSLLLSLFMLSVINSSLVQSQTSDNLTETIQHFYSTTLSDSVSIQIALPDNYLDSQKDFPVLYMLDGQWFFPHALSIRTDFTGRNGPKYTPDFIIVGITTSNDNRWQWSTEKISAFLGFMENDLIPFVDQNYRTSNERLIFGWETTGGAVLKTLSHKSDLFDAYFAASPAPLYGDYFPNLEEEHLAFENFLVNNKDLDKFLFIGQGESDYPVQFGIQILEGVLETHAPKKLDWQIEILIGVSHQMSAYHTLHKGLLAYYHHFHYLTFINKQVFEKLGGLEYVETFYKIRAKQFSVENNEEAKHATRRNLTFVAIEENDYQWFDELLETFKSDGLMEKSFPPHINSYAQFYLKHNNTLKAKDISYFLIEKYPENAEGYHTLGIINLVLNNDQEAKKYLQIAVEKAETNNDWRIEQYKKDLSQLDPERLKK